MFAVMNVLALDTASPMPAVALATEEGSWEERLSSDRRASEELLGAVARVLEAAGSQLSLCNRIAACSGPGSFTGTRVGLATAWGLARALGIPIESVSTLEALSEAARARGATDVHAALDRGRGEVLVQPFSLQGPRAQPIGPLERLSREEAASRFSAVRLVSLPQDLLVRPGEPLEISPARALALAAMRVPRQTADPQAIYARPSAAEEKLVSP